MASDLFNPEKKTSINQRFRERRFKFFLSLLASIKSDKPIEILDIGGTEIYWERMNFDHASNVRITLLNLEAVPVKGTIFRSVKGDACNLAEYKDKQFDVVFSNSVIEHLFSYENQQKMANEAMRVGKNYYVQTPNYLFPIEPHWLFPGFQYLPFNTRVFLTQNFDLGNYKKSPKREDAINRVNEVKLLTEKQMKALFPDGNVYREYFFGLVKSLTMYRFPGYVGDKL